MVADHHHLRIMLICVHKPGVADCNPGISDNNSTTAVPIAPVINDKPGPSKVYKKVVNRSVEKLKK